MGGQLEYFGLWIDSEFGAGQSKAEPTCITYNSPQLSAKPSFNINKLEVWAVGPEPKDDNSDEVNMPTLTQIRIFV